MHIRSSHNFRKMFATSTAVLVAMLLVGISLEMSGITDFTDSDKMGPTKAEEAEQKKEELEAKKNFIESDDPQKNYETPAAAIELKAQQENNGSVTVLTKLSNVSNGQCRLVVRNGSQEDLQTADVIYQPDFSSCAGFSVDKKNLGSGNWTITLFVESASTAEKTITFAVK